MIQSVVHWSNSSLFSPVYRTTIEAHLKIKQHGHYKIMRAWCKGVDRTGLNIFFGQDGLDSPTTLFQDLSSDQLDGRTGLETFHIPVWHHQLFDWQDQSGCTYERDDVRQFSSTSCLRIKLVYAIRSAEV